MSQIFFNEVVQAWPTAGYPSDLVGSMATISSYNYTPTLPNNFWYISRVLRFTAMGTIDPKGNQINFRILQLGETLVLWTAALFNTASPVFHTYPIPYLFQIVLTCRAVGNATNSNVIGVAAFTSACNVGIGSHGTDPSQDTATSKNIPVTAPAVQAGFNVNSALDITFQGQSSFVDCQQLIIESLN